MSLTDPALAVPALEPRRGLRCRRVACEGSQQFANVMVFLKRMSQRPFRVQLIVIAASVATPGEVPVGDELRDDALCGTFGNADGYGDVA